MSPGFAPPQPFFRPPPSPGFGAHRFGKQEQGFGFVPLNLSPPPKAPKAKPKPIINPVEIEKKNFVPERHVTTTITRYAADDSALLSPRVEAMTNNPLRGPLPSFPGMQFMEVPPTPGEGLFSPRETMFPRDPFYPFGRPTQVADPRSPPTVGETPIVRSIDELI
jgi:tyrosine-protein phosphatase